MPSSDTGQFAAGQFHRLLQDFWIQVKKTARKPDADTIHDLRVAIRRLDQVLATFGEWFPPRKAAAIRRRTKSLLEAAGAVRDCDIAIEVLGKSAAADISVVADELHVRRKGAENRLLASVRGLVRQRAASRWREDSARIQTPTEASGVSWDDFGRREVSRRARGFFESGNRARKKASAADLHKFRIAAKKFRYTFELFQSAFGPDAEARIQQIRAVQSALGDVNDLRATRKLLDDFGGGKKLDALLRKKQRKKIAGFRSLWEAQFPEREAKTWMQSLRQPPRKPVARSESAKSPVAIASGQ